MILQYNIRFELYSDIQTDFFSRIFFTYCENLYTNAYALATHVTYILLLPVLLLSTIES